MNKTIFLIVISALLTSKLFPKTVIIEPISSFAKTQTYGADNYSIEIYNNKLYSVNTRSLQVFDISNNFLELISDLDLDGQTRSLSLCNESAFVSAGPPINRLYQININNPINLSLIDTLSYFGSYVHFIDNNNLFVHEWDYDYNSWKINVYNCNSMQQISQFLVPFNTNVMRKADDGIGIIKINDMAYLYDISNPNDIQLITSGVIGETFFPNYSQILQDSILVYGDGVGLRFYDITNNWQLINSLDYPIINFAVEDNHLVIHNDGVLELYDISNLYSIILSDSISFGYFDGVQCVKLFNDILYYTTDMGCLEMYQISNNEFIHLDSYYSFGGLEAAYYYDDYLAISTTLNGLTSWDISNLLNPIQMQSYYENLYPGENLNGENNIFNYKCYDIEQMLIHYKSMEMNESGSISEIAELTTIDNGGSIYFKQNVGYFKVHNEFLYKYELVDNDLIEVASISLPQADWGEIYFYNNIAYILSAFKLSIISNINSNDNITLYDQIDISIFGPNSLDFFESYMIISEQTESNICYFFNITDPLNPDLETSIDNSGLIAIDHDNELMFLGNSSIVIYDLGTINTGIIPEIKSMVNWNYCEQIIPFQKNDVFYLLYLDHTGCSVYEYECIPTEATHDFLTISPTLSNYPNPFNPSTEIRFQISGVRQFENTEISIYNLKGQKVKTFSNLQITQSANQQIVWDGTDRNNQPVSSGVYFYQLKNNGKAVAQKKCLLIK
ncbi:MAG: gliding motility-associated C-terminal domain-containing protein [Candidatus Cloacimonetes bacterium]|nr:gliding motility-associated C-terminal domain-containing protein [Candidatus Cloacimonadota bacterium]MCF7869180.1 gliding motility-associated C-terminal domain-containing protein [Candidatus Cloacimonadota bacterium]